MLDAIRTAIEGLQQNEATFFCFHVAGKNQFHAKPLGPLLSKKLIEINRRIIFFIE